MAIVPITNLRGPAARISSVTDENVPADVPSSVTMTGQDQDRRFHFKLSRGLPGVNAIENDEAVAAYIAALDSDTRAALANAFTGRAAVPAFRALKTALEDGTRSTAIQVMSDSTGDATNEWPYLLGEAIGAAHPEWSVHWRNWSDAVQDFLAPVWIQTGAAGQRYLDCSSGSTTRRLAPAALPHLPGVIDVKMRLSVADWTPVAGKTFLGRSGADGARGFYVGIQASTGRLQFSYSTGGTAATLAVMTATTPPTVADGDITWLRWVFTPDDGAGNRILTAYQSNNGSAWTLLSTTTTAGAVSVFDNSATTGLELGGVASGIGDSTAKIYEVSVASSIGGPNLVPTLPDLWPPFNVSAAQVVGAPILTIVNAARSGADIAYWSDPTRLGKATPDFGQSLIVKSDSHNEGTASGRSFVSTYDTWGQAVEVEVPGAPSIDLTQNPEKSGTPWYREHAKRRLDIIANGDAQNRGVIDTYQAFLDYGDWQTDLMLDDVHPNSAGQIVWRDKILAAYDAS